MPSVGGGTLSSTSAVVEVTSGHQRRQQTTQPTTFRPGLGGIGLQQLTLDVHRNPPFLLCRMEQEIHLTRSSGTKRCHKKVRTKDSKNTLHTMPTGLPCLPMFHLSSLEATLLCCDLSFEPSNFFGASSRNPDWRRWDASLQCIEISSVRSCNSQRLQRKPACSRFLLQRRYLDVLGHRENLLPVLENDLVKFCSKWFLVLKLQAPTLLLVEGHQLHLTQSELLLVKLVGGFLGLFLGGFHIHFIDSQELRGTSMATNDVHFNLHLNLAVFDMEVSLQNQWKKKKLEQNQPDPTKLAFPKSFFWGNPTKRSNKTSKKPADVCCFSGADHETPPSLGQVDHLFDANFHAVSLALFCF